MESAIAEQDLIACGWIRMGTGDLMVDVKMAFQRMRKILTFIERSIHDAMIYFRYWSYAGFFNELCRSTCDSAQFFINSTDHMR